MNRNRKNLNKQIEFVYRNLIDEPGGLEHEYILKLKDIVKGMDSEDYHTRAENQESWADEIEDIATPDYYDYLSRHYSILNYKNEFYKACMYANDAIDLDERDRVMCGFRRIIESALYKITEQL